MFTQFVVEFIDFIIGSLEARLIWLIFKAL